MKRRVEPKPTFDGELGCHLHISDAVNLSVSGVSALAAPVFDESGKIVLSLTAIGPSALFDVGLKAGLRQL
jgi:hypothetical protein